MLRDRDLVPDRKKGISWKRGILVLFPAFFSALLLAYFIHRFWIFPFSVVNDEMSPAYPPSATVYINRRFNPQNLKPGTVVLARFPGSEDWYILRRIAALGGESIELRSRKIYINGSPIQEPGRKLLETSTLPVGVIPDLYSRRDTMPTVQVSQGSYFLLADNRLSGLDSRDFGPISQDQIVGIIEQN